MNKPYVKEYNELGEVVNPITKDSPYLHSSLNNRVRRKIIRGKYQIFTNPITGNFIGFGSKLHGNNKKRTKFRKKHGRR